MKFSKCARLLAICCAVYPLSVAVSAQRGGIASLKGVEIPHAADAARYVADPQTLVVLGKALFWDAQVGSDGRTACATCHFHAGADHRVTNQIAGPATSTAPARSNATLSIGDFPFHAFANPNDNGSEVARNRREVVGSAGVVQRTFVAVTHNGAVDVGATPAVQGSSRSVA